MCNTNKMSLSTTLLLATILVAIVLDDIYAFSVPRKPKILVLGGSGFVGSEICRQLQDRQIDFVATSTTGSSSSSGSPSIETVKLDLTSPGASQEVSKLASDCTAVISTVGSIGTPQDLTINAATGRVAAAAAAQNVDRFVFIGNDDRVRSFSQSIPALSNYAKGKQESEQAIRDAFGPDRYCIVQPTFIHGGTELGLNPPRIPGRVGQVVEDVLGLYPLLAFSENLPGILGVALEPPVSCEKVAAAAVSAALGLCEGSTELSSRDDINLAASRRSKQPQQETTTSDKSVQELKEQLFGLGDCTGNPDKMQEAFHLLEQLESLRPRSMRPAQDSSLNGRWNFVFDVEPDMGTGVIKKMLQGDSPIKPILDLSDVYMEIDGQTNIDIKVKTKILGVSADLVLSTSITPDESDPNGTMFMEKFQGVELSDKKWPVPDSWKRSRPLEFSYLDQDMLIARGNGGEPHFLLRDKS